MINCRDMSPHETCLLSYLISLQFAFGKQSIQWQLLGTFVVILEKHGIRTRLSMYEIIEKKGKEKNINGDFNKT